MGRDVMGRDVMGRKWSVNWTKIALCLAREAWLIIKTTAVFTKLKSPEN